MPQGNQLCYTHTTPTVGIITIPVKFDCMGSVLSIIGGRSILTVCEVQVYAVPYNMCKAFETI